MEAIRLLKMLEEDQRLATPKEQEILSRFVGWGGLSQAFDERDDKWSAEYEELKDLADTGGIPGSQRIYTECFLHFSDCY